MKTSSLVLLCLAATLDAADPLPAVNVTKETAFTFYRDFKRLTKQPHHVAPLTALLCTYPGPELIEREKRATGLHYKTGIHIYANPLAADAITRKLGVFAPGAVIVKEKLERDGSVGGVGGMIKRAPGFDAGNADWEYFYADPTAGFFIGRLKNCVDCHANTKATDFVYSAWHYAK